MCAAPTTAAPWALVGLVEPLKPTVEMTPATHMAAKVSERILRGVSQPKWWF